MTTTVDRIRGNIGDVWRSGIPWTVWEDCVLFNAVEIRPEGGCEQGATYVNPVGRALCLPGKSCSAGLWVLLSVILEAMFRTFSRFNSLCDKLIWVAGLLDVLLMEGTGVETGAELGQEREAWEVLSFCGEIPGRII